MNDNEGNPQKMYAVQYVDYSEYYMVYGSILLIFVILLLWYFVRSNLTDRCYTEGLTMPINVNNKLPVGMVGSVPVYFVDPYKPKIKWRKPNSGLYFTNSRLFWENDL